MIVGFTGHQRIDHPDRWGWVQEQFARILGELADGRVSASLADGGDQLFVETALALGRPIDVILPCAGYETTFSDANSAMRYRDLLARAVTVHTLDFPRPSEEAFLAAGKYIVDRASLVVALWNGKPAAGKGGTGDIVGYARSLNRPVVHIHPDLLQVSGPA